VITRGVIQTFVQPLPDGLLDDPTNISCKLAECHLLDDEVITTTTTSTVAYVYVALRSSVDRFSACHNTNADEYRRTSLVRVKFRAEVSKSTRWPQHSVLDAAPSTEPQKCASIDCQWSVCRADQRVAIPASSAGSGYVFLHVNHLRVTSELALRLTARDTQVYRREAAMQQLHQV
jgi:hypothetical protein